ncbi:cellulose binding domain-containing protein [Actinoplanes sp. NPDC004185]
MSLRLPLLVCALVLVAGGTGDATVTGWSVEFDPPAGTTVTSSWSSVRTSTGNHHRFTDASWNGTVAPGATVSFGFNVAALGVPVGCTINGAPCAGGTAPTTAPPTAPPATTPPATGPVVDVSTADQLSAALAAARPGQTIRLAPGTYRGAFLGRVAGTAAAPITLTGPATAILTNPESSGTNPGCSVPAAGFDPGYGFWLYGAAHWTLSGFTVTGAAKGIMIDASPHVTIDGVFVHDIGDEGVHFRRSSADGVIRDSRIERTGTAQPQYGEGIYLGSATSNWSCYGNTGGIDASDRIQVLNNRVGPDVAAEHLDVKEGTVGGVIRGNIWNGQGIAGQNSADSWLDVKGSNYLIESNTGTFSAPGVFANGYETHNPTAGSGCGNVWRDNRSDLGGAGKWAINVTSTSKCAGNLNVVHASNTVTGATSGLTNIAVTP